MAMQELGTTTPDTRTPPRTLRAHAAPQPYKYPPARDFHEPDWTRLPGYKDVTRQEWESAKWQRQRTVKNLGELAKVFEHHLDAELLEDIRRDMAERATMSMLITPQMLNTMDETNLRDD